MIDTLYLIRLEAVGDTPRETALWPLGNEGTDVLVGLPSQEVLAT